MINLKHIVLGQTIIKYFTGLKYFGLFHCTQTKERAEDEGHEKNQYNLTENGNYTFFATNG